MEVYEKEHEYGYIRDQKIYLKGFLDFPDRQIGQVKESEEASIKYFEKRFEFARQKVLDLEKLIEEAQNKGSYLMKLIHMRKYLSNFDGLGDYVVLFKKLDELEDQLRDLISVNRVKNLEIKTALLQEAIDILNQEDVLKAVEDFKELKLKWIKTGAVADEMKDEIEQKFNDITQALFTKRKNHIKNRSRQARNNLNEYRRILMHVDDIKSSDDFEKTFEDFKHAQQAWKNAGKIPHKKALEFWEKFKKINDYFFNRYKNYKELKAEFPQLSAIEIKNKFEQELLKKAEELLESNDDSANENAKNLLIEWKKISTTFHSIDNEIYQKFRNTCDKIFELSYLLRVVKRKYPDLDRKPKEDQLKIKISFMRELARRDESEVANSEHTLLKMTGPNVKRMELQNLQNNLSVQKRKLSVKKQLIAEFETELNNFKKK